MKYILLFIFCFYSVAISFSQKVKRCDEESLNRIMSITEEIEKLPYIYKLDTAVSEPLVLLLEDQSGSADSVYINPLLGSMNSIRRISLFYPNYNSSPRTVLLPSSIGELSNLEIMDVSCGNLIVPDEIKNCKRLKYLDIHGNINNGELPQSIGNLDSLMHLSVHLYGNDDLKVGKMIQSLKILKNNSSINLIEIYCPWYSYPRALWVSMILRRKGICARVII